jgi:hypothetical protein
MPRFSEFSLTAQTAYAQLFEAASALGLERDVSHLRGSFSRKTVKGRRYWYFQFRGITGKGHQLYVGPDSEATRALIERHKEGPPDVALQPLAGSAEALGLEPIHPRHLRVLRRLDEHGFFRAGGVLVGTHAFLAHGSMLGVRWGAPPRTEDLDLAHAGRNISIALPANVEVDTHAAIESLAMGLVPTTTLSGGAGPSYINPAEPAFRIDFLTTLHRGREEPYEHPALHATLQPLKFLEYLLVDTTQAVLFCARGCVVANIPSPARYALHKLLVQGERTSALKTKSAKDLHQAACLLELLRGEDSAGVEVAWSDLLQRGPGWRKRAKEGLDAIERVAPELGLRDWLGLKGRRQGRF